jgi:hypothetical protein
VIGALYSAIAAVGDILGGMLVIGPLSAAIAIREHASCC